MRQLLKKRLALFLALAMAFSCLSGVAVAQEDVAADEAVAVADEAEIEDSADAEVEAVAPWRKRRPTMASPPPAPAAET